MIECKNVVKLRKGFTWKFEAAPNCIFRLNLKINWLEGLIIYTRSTVARVNFE